MKKAITTGLPDAKGPIERAILAGRTLYTTASPTKADGTTEKGSAAKQATLTLSNLARILKAAGGSMADVTQAMLYVTDRRFIAPITKVWAKAFSRPYPNRATVIVKGIGLPGAKLVIMAQARIPKAGKRSRKRRSGTD